MSDQNDVAVHVSEDSTPKRGRPKKEGVKLGVKPRKDFFAAAFGDSRAKVAIRGMKKEERKALSAAVRKARGAAHARQKIEARMKKLAEKSEKLAKKIEELNDAEAAVKSFRLRVLAGIEFIYNLAPGSLTAAEADNNEKEA